MNILYSIRMRKSASLKN